MGERLFPGLEGLQCGLQVAVLMPSRQLVSKKHPSTVKNESYFSALHENYVGERPTSAEVNVQRERH